MLSQAHLYIKGDVLDVGFRAWTKIQAKLHMISGWARNAYGRPDLFGPRGGVEIMAQGEESDLLRFVAELKKGSPLSRVDNIEVVKQDPKEIFEGFEIRKSELR